MVTYDINCSGCGAAMQVRYRADPGIEQVERYEAKAKCKKCQAAADAADDSKLDALAPGLGYARRLFYEAAAYVTPSYDDEQNDAGCHSVGPAAEYELSEWLEDKPLASKYIRILMRGGTDEDARKAIANG